MEILGVAGICRNTPYIFLHLIIPLLPITAKVNNSDFPFLKMPRNK